MATYDVALTFDVEVDYVNTDREDRLLSIHLVSVLPAVSVTVVKVESPTP